MPTTNTKMTRQSSVKGAAQAGTKPATTPAVRQQSERTPSENKERAYVAASRRGDRSIEARVESAKMASQCHYERTGKHLRVSEEIVRKEEMYEEEDDRLPRIFRGSFQDQFQGHGLSQRFHDASIVQLGMASGFGTNLPTAEGIEAAFAAAFPGLASGRNLSFNYRPMPGPPAPPAPALQPRRPSASVQQPLQSPVPASIAPMDLDRGSAYMSRSASTDSIHSPHHTHSRQSSVSISASRQPRHNAMQQQAQPLMMSPSFMNAQQQTQPDLHSTSQSMSQAMSPTRRMSTGWPSPSTSLFGLESYGSALTSPVALPSALPQNNARSQLGNPFSPMPSLEHRRSQSFDARAHDFHYMDTMDNTPASETLPSTSAHLSYDQQYYGAPPAKRMRSDAGLLGMSIPAFDRRNSGGGQAYNTMYNNSSAMVSPNAAGTPMASPHPITTPSGPRKDSSDRQPLKHHKKRPGTSAHPVPKLQQAPTQRRPIAKIKANYDQQPATIRWDEAAWREAAEALGAKREPGAEKPLSTTQTAPAADDRTKKPVPSVETASKETYLKKEPVSPQNEMSMHDLAEPLISDVNNPATADFFTTADDQYDFSDFGFGAGSGYVDAHYTDQQFDMSDFFEFPASQEVELDTEDLFPTDV